MTDLPLTKNKEQTNEDILQNSCNKKPENKTEEGEWLIHHIKKDTQNYSDELNDRILNHLQKLQIINSDEADYISDIYKVQDVNIADILVQKRFLKKFDAGQIIADFFHCNFAALEDVKIDIDTLLEIPEEVAKNSMVIAFAQDDNTVSLAMLNPHDYHLVHLMEKKFNKKAIIYYSTPKYIYDSLKLYKQNLGNNIDHLISCAMKDIKHLDSLNNISAIFDTLILMAYNRGASDIHIEPFEDDIKIRFRIDGVLQKVNSLPSKFLDTIINHIKILSKMRTDEHNSAQDGRFHVVYNQTRINFRVSVVPTHYGEKSVLRLLPVELQELTLTDLGYADSDKKLIENNILKSSGIVLVTGPTGSGKTTTLYSLLKKLNEDEVNISTIEDPIEYGIEGINQIQVNSKTNITFAEGLRSLLRQDPDILMIGEIRDAETAKIVMHASLTGHLVLSTLHTNNASLSPLRLIQMGADPYLIVSTVNLIVAQRLVRKICSDCMVSYKPSKKDIDEYRDKFLLTDENKNLFDDFFSKKTMRLFKGKGCKKCSHTCYQGRTVIAEVMEVSSDIESLIIKKASESDIKKASVKNGMQTMFEDGLCKAAQGITSLDELFRILNQ